MSGEETYPLFEESDWKSLWGMARRHPQQKAEFLQLGNEMKAYDKAVWDNERNPDVLPPERLNLIDRISLIVNGGRLFSRDHESWKRIAEFVNGIRQQCEAARHERYVQFSREAPPAAPQSFSRSLDEIGPVEFSAWKEDEHPRGQPENAGEFASKPGEYGMDSLRHLLGEVQAGRVSRKKVPHMTFEYSPDVVQAAVQHLAGNTHVTPEAMRQQREQSAAAHKAARDAEKAEFLQVFGDTDWKSVLKSRDGDLSDDVLNGSDWADFAKQVYEERDEGDDPGDVRETVIYRLLTSAQEDQERLDEENRDRESAEEEQEQRAKDEEQRHDPGYIASSLRSKAENAERHAYLPDRESRKEARAAIQMSEAHDWLVENGWAAEYLSRGSAYFQKWNPSRNQYDKFRIADHEVPATEERKWNAGNGGFSWATSNNQIVLPVHDLDGELSSLLANESDDEDKE